MADDDEPARPSKRARHEGPSNLDSFVVRSSDSRPLPAPVFTTPKLEDRDSTFVGSIFKARSAKDVTRILEHVKHVLQVDDPASHNMAAWRFLTLKRGKDGLSGPDDFVVQSGSEDDGEKYGGQKILKAMETNGTVDAVVVCSRWFGGTMLGPVRFTHINTVATDCCKQFAILDAVDDQIARLEILDQRLAELRLRLADLSTSPNPASSSQASSKPPPDYAHLKNPPDLQKATRLVTAREKAVAGLEKMLAQREARENAAKAAEARMKDKIEKPAGGFVLDDENEVEAEGAGVGLGISA